MLTSKQRAILRGLANKEETILQIGKQGISEATVKQIADALEARELIKGRVLESCEISPAEASRELAEKTASEVVQVIGSRFVLYRRNPEKPRIQLD